MSTYPLSTCHFLVEWGGSRVGVTEVIGLSMEINTINYREGAEKEYIPNVMPGQEKINPIILKRGIVKGDNEYYDWLNTVKLNTVERRDLTISLLNENHEPVVTWKLTNAFPTKITWSDLKAYANEPAIESIEITHEGITVQNE